MAEPYGNHSDPSERQGRDRYGERLVVRSAPIPDPGENFLDQVPEPAVVAWVRGERFGGAILTVAKGGITRITVFNDPMFATTSGR